MKIAHTGFGIAAAAAIAFAPLPILFGPSAHAGICDEITDPALRSQCIARGNDEAPPQPLFPKNDAVDCVNHAWNSCPYCKHMGKTYPQPPQPVLPCDHSKYQ